MPTLIALTAGINPVHVRKIVHTVIGEVLELEAVVPIAETFETHISTDHVLTITELDPTKPMLELTELDPGAVVQAHPADAHAGQAAGAAGESGGADSGAAPAGDAPLATSDAAPAEGNAEAAPESSAT